MDEVVMIQNRKIVVGDWFTSLLTRLHYFSRWEKNAMLRWDLSTAKFDWVEEARGVIEGLK
jgi:hypothetical protein